MRRQARGENTKRREKRSSEKHGDGRRPRGAGSCSAFAAGTLGTHWQCGMRSVLCVRQWRSGARSRDSGREWGQCVCVCGRVAGSLALGPIGGGGQWWRGRRMLFFRADAGVRPIASVVCAPAGRSECGARPSLDLLLSLRGHRGTKATPPPPRGRARSCTTPSPFPLPEPCPIRKPAIQWGRKRTTVHAAIVQF